MRAMASRLLSSLKSHPLITASSVLLLFALPILRMLIFFWPLIVSTVLGVLAAVSFARTTEEHDAIPPAPETASQADAAIALSSHEGKIGNVLRVGNREVTWLEWLHNEDTQELCLHESETAVWDRDANGCDSMYMPREVMGSSHGASTDASTGKPDVLDDAPLLAVGEGLPHVLGSPDDEQMALVSTEKDEAMDAALPSAVLDGIKASDIVPVPLALRDLNTETMSRKTSTAKDRTKPGQNVCRVQVLEVHPSVDKAIAYASQQGIAQTHEQEVRDMTLPNEHGSLVPEIKESDVRKVLGITDVKKEVNKGSNLSGPQWDVSDGEEDQSGLCFSFFHNSSHTPAIP